MNANEIITCCECGCTEEELFELDGAYYCADCLKRLGYVQCEECGNWILEDDAIPYVGGYVCEDCAGDLGLVQCEECGTWLPEDDAESVEGSYGQVIYCPECFGRARDRGRVYFCDHCETWYQESYRSHVDVHDGTTVCSECYHDSYSTCERCGEVFPSDDLFWVDEEDAYYCEDCEERVRARHEGIHNYSFKPSPVFHRMPDETSAAITMGFELEVDKGDDRDGCAEEIANAFDEDTLYMKNDGSVDFEIVTHPRTLRSYLEDFNFDTLCEIPRRFDYKSHTAGTCGLHIHVGREQLGSNWEELDKTIAKIAVLMYRMWPALKIFSRRNESQLDSWAHPPKFEFFRDSYSEDELRKEVSRYYDYRDRYQALNLKPHPTIEFRLWRGSLIPRTLKATLQLTYNMVMFAKTNTMYDVVNASWDDVTNYETIPELEEYLKERQLESFTGLQYIPFRRANESIKPKFNVGDTVRFVNTRGGEVSSVVLGASGRVLFSRPCDTYGVEYAVQFAEDFNERDVYGHGCEGHAPNNDGYWAYEENLELVSSADGTVSQAINF